MRAAVLALVLAVPAAAEGLYAAGDPAAVAEAPRLAQAAGVPALVQSHIDGMSLLAMATLAQQGLSFAARASLAQSVIMPDLRAAAPALEQQWTGILASQLSADDMKAIEAFYATPAGQHLRAAQPQIAASLKVATLAWDTAGVNGAIARHQDEIDKKADQP